MHPFLDFGIIKIPVYSLMFITGFFLATLVVYKRRAEFCMDSTDAVCGGLFGAVYLLLGAKLFYFLSKLPNIIAGYDIYLKWLKTSPLEAIDYAFGGMVFYGGLIGFIFGVYRYSRRFHVPFIAFTEGYAPLIPFVHGMGRIGCFFAGCCYGIEYYGPLSVRFPPEAIGEGASLVPRFPVQLLEAGLNFILVGILFFLQKKYGCDVRKLCAAGQQSMRGQRENAGSTEESETPAEKKRIVPGGLLGIYLLCYGIIRFILEFWRGDAERGIFFDMLSTSQIISLLMVPVAIGFIRGRFVKLGK